MALLLFPEQSDSDALTINDVSCGNGIRADGMSGQMWQWSWSMKHAIWHCMRKRHTETAKRFRRV